MCERFNQVKLSLDEEEVACAELREIIERSISDAHQAGKDASYEERLKNAEQKANKEGVERIEEQASEGIAKKRLQQQRRVAMSPQKFNVRPVYVRSMPYPHSYGYVPPVLSRRVSSPYPPQYHPYVRPVVRKIYSASYPPSSYTKPIGRYPHPRGQVKSKNDMPPPSYKAPDGYPITMPLHTSPPTLPDTNTGYISPQQNRCTRVNVHPRAPRKPHDE